MEHIWILLPYALPCNFLSLQLKLPKILLIAMVFTAQSGYVMAQPLTYSTLKRSGCCQVTVLCYWTRYFTLTMPLSIQGCQWVPANCQGKLTKCLPIACDGQAFHPGREGQKYFQLLHGSSSTETGITSGQMSHLS